MKKVVVVLLIGLILGLAVSFVTAVVVEKTSTPKFCGSCHTMKPMVKSFNISVHGSNNKHGYSVAHCTDCHLPHDSLAGYLIAKGITGIKDGLIEIGMFKNPDFEKKYAEMSSYVYDSGCLKCHTGIKNPSAAYKMSEASKYAHKLYWKEKKEHKNISCVSCHNDSTNPNFAHPELLERINK